MGGFAPRTVFAEVYVNGDYHGFYLVQERIDEDYIDVRTTHCLINYQLTYFNSF